MKGVMKQTKKRCGDYNHPVCLTSGARMCILCGVPWNRKRRSVRKPKEGA